jgi:hypothetical protein
MRFARIAVMRDPLKWLAAAASLMFHHEAVATRYDDAPVVTDINTLLYLQPCLTQDDVLIIPGNHTRQCRVV